MPLFVVLKNNAALDDVIKQKIRTNLRNKYSPRHVPDDIIQIREVPYTLSGKKMELPVKKILMGQPIHQVANADTMKNPKALEQFKGMNRK